jgi:putative ABC transport system permease protein
MIKNYFKMAWRSLLKQKGFSFINIFGLATGMACSLLIFLFVKDETSYDRFHHDAGQIYRVVKDFVNDDGSRLPDATTPPALAPAMQKDIPEVAVTTRVFPGWGANFLIKYGDKKISEDKLYRVDSSSLMFLLFLSFMEMQKMLLKKYNPLFSLSLPQKDILAMITR